MRNTRPGQLSAVLLGMLVLVSGCGMRTPQAAPNLAVESVVQPTRDLSFDQERAQPVQTAAPAIPILAASLSHGLDAAQQPRAPTDQFQPNDQISLSVTLAGRHQHGQIDITIYARDKRLYQIALDLATLGPAAPGSPNTVLGVFLPTTRPWQISERYRAEVRVDGALQWTLPFQVIPPAGTIPSQVKQVALARGADDDYNPVEPTSEFLVGETVYLVGNAALGTGSWLEAIWYVNDQPYPQPEQVLGPNDTDLSSMHFAFQFRPEEDWPAGEHAVVLLLNDALVGRYRFTVADAPATLADDSELQAPASVPTPADLVFYEHPSRIMGIEVPADWIFTDASVPGALTLIWTAPGGAGQIMVELRNSPEQNSIDQLTNMGQEYIASHFAEQPEFTLFESELQEQIVSIPFSFSPNMGNFTIDLLGDTFVEQYGSLVSILTIVFPEEESPESWDILVDRVINSYEIDEAGVVR